MYGHSVKEHRSGSLAWRKEMQGLQRGQRFLLLSALILVLSAVTSVASSIQMAARAHSSAAKPVLPGTVEVRDGGHDFDFNIGTWKTHVSRLLHPLTGSNTWVEYDGISVVRKVWNARATLFELEVDGPAGHIEGVGLRLYNAQSDQWSLNWANSHDGNMNPPMIGEFKNGRGEFFDQETFNGKAIYARNSFSDITPDSSRFEQAFSDDGGKTWETNWIMTFTRINDGSDKAR
jgi:hypothetical protein